MTTETIRRNAPQGIYTRLRSHAGRTPERQGQAVRTHHVAQLGLALAHLAELLLNKGALVDETSALPRAAASTITGACSM
jgi:hypothetical protein